MNVLHLVGGLPTEAKPHLQPFILSQINSLIKLGINVEILDLKGHESTFNYFNSGKLIRKLGREKEIQLIHAHYVYCGVSALLARTNLPIVLSLMGSDLLGSPDSKGNLTLRGKFDRSLTKFISRQVDMIIVKSKRMKEQLSINKPIEVIPNGVNFNIFKPEGKTESREKLGINKSSFLILFLGNPDLYRKNFQLAKNATELFGKIPGVNNIELLAPFGTTHTDVVTYMNACDVLLLTSFWEGSPNVIKEALACNLPFISTDVGDASEIISDVNNSFIVPYDANIIAEKMKIIYDNRQRSNGRDKIDYLRDDKIAIRIIENYNKMIKNNQPKN